MSYYNQGQQPPPVGVPPPQGYPQQDAAYNKDATPGYPPPQGYPQQGYPPQGYPPQVYPPQGYPPQGYPPQYVPQYTAPPPPPPQQPANNSGCLEGWYVPPLITVQYSGDCMVSCFVCCFDYTKHL